VNQAQLTVVGVYHVLVVCSSRIADFQPLQAVAGSEFKRAFLSVFYRNNIYPYIEYSVSVGGEFFSEQVVTYLDKSSHHWPETGFWELVNHATQRHKMRNIGCREPRRGQDIPTFNCQRRREEPRDNH